jgi:hypothetical protein
MRRRAGLHRYQAGRLLGQKRRHPRPRQHAVVQNRPIRADRADLKAAFRQVDRQHADLRGHQCALRSVAMEPSWHTRCRWVGASTASVHLANQRGSCTILQSDGFRPNGRRCRSPHEDVGSLSVFRQRTQDHIRQDASFAAVKRLVAALLDHLKLIVLDLDQGDEPQAIFETLNAHGAPLLPADLMKNWLLWGAGRARKDIEALYTHHWLPFDREHS